MKRLIVLPLLLISCSSHPFHEVWTTLHTSPLQAEDSETPSNLRVIVPGQAVTVWDGPRFRGGTEIVNVRCETPESYCQRLPDWVRKDAVICKGIK